MADSASTTKAVAKFAGIEIPPELARNNFFFLYLNPFFAGMLMSVLGLLQPAFLKDIIKISFLSSCGTTCYESLLAITGVPMKRFADIIIEKRLLFLAIIILVSLFFAYKLKDLEVYTKYADLLPQGHEYIKVHNKIRAQFGGANTITMILQVKEGDIFNPTTLQKIRDISDELFLIPGADRFKVLSLGVDKLVEMVTTSGGFEFHPLMFPNIPQTPEEIETLRQRVYGSVYYGSFIWFDSKKTLITADFFEDEIDYSVVFKELLRIQDKYEDDNHILAINGEPLHLGYVDSYVDDIFLIMLGTFLVMFILFYYWYRSLRATVIPFLAAFLSGLWGLGFMCLLGYNLDPLILVFPFLIASRAACHTVQVIKRYTEECLIVNDSKSACKRVIEGMFIPGFTAITTDAMGIILIALNPHPDSSEDHHGLYLLVCCPDYHCRYSGTHHLKLFAYFTPSA